MSKDTFYFSHDYNARSDIKLITLQMKHGMEGIGIFWCVIEMLYEEGGYLPLEYERIAFVLRTDNDTIKSVITEFDLFKISGDKFYSESVLSRLKKRCEKSEKARISISKRWNKLNNDTNVLPSNNERTPKERKGKERKEKEYSADFLSFWNAYPKKSGSKKAAFDNWQKLNGGKPDIETILAAIKDQIEWRENARDGDFRPEWKDPERWIKGKMWEAELTTQEIDLKAWAKKRQAELDAEDYDA